MVIARNYYFESRFYSSDDWLCMIMHGVLDTTGKLSDANLKDISDLFHKDVKCYYAIVSFQGKLLILTQLILYSSSDSFFTYNMA